MDYHYEGIAFLSLYHEGQDQDSSYNEAHQHSPVHAHLRDPLQSLYSQEPLQNSCKVSSFDGITYAAGIDMIKEVKLTEPHLLVLVAIHARQEEICSLRDGYDAFQT